VNTVTHRYDTSAVLPQFLLAKDRQKSERRFQTSTTFLRHFLCFQTVNSKNFSESYRSYSCLILSQKTLVDDSFRLNLDSIFVYALLSNNFEISTRDYVSVSAHMQWQNAMWLRRTYWLCGLSCRSAGISFQESRVRTPMKARTRVLFLVFLCN